MESILQGHGRISPLLQVSLTIALKPDLEQKHPLDSIAYGKIKKYLNEEINIALLPTFRSLEKDL
jgi:hypothetical protein